jgi:hypothetical protein
LYNFIKNLNKKDYNKIASFKVLEQFLDLYDHIKILRKENLWLLKGAKPQLLYLKNRILEFPFSDSLITRYRYQQYFIDEEGPQKSR